MRIVTLIDVITAWPTGIAVSMIASTVTNIHVERVTEIVTENVLRDSNVGTTILIDIIHFLPLVQVEQA